MQHDDSITDALRRSLSWHVGNESTIAPGRSNLRLSVEDGIGRVTSHDDRLESTGCVYLRGYVLAVKRLSNRSVLSTEALKY